MNTIPFFDPAASHSKIRNALDEAYQRVLGSGIFILGAEVEAFEAEFSDYCGTAHCIGTSNGLDALQLILRAAGIGPGDEVIVPAQTFIATWLAVSLVGATPVGADCLDTTCNIDPDAAGASITPRTRAIIAVHLYGQPANMVALAALASRHGLMLIEDAAQAHGARYRGRRAGSLGDAAAFSFYPTKNLGALGDGGAVTTRDPSLAHNVRRLANYGSTRKYHHEAVGQNARLDELQAAFLRAKLPHLDQWNDQRRTLADRYHRLLGGFENIRLLQNQEDAEPVWHLYPVRITERDRIHERLSMKGIGTAIHYPVPPHLQPAYRGHSSRNFPIAERISLTTLSLPLFPGIPHADIDRVCAVLSDATD